MRRWFVVLMATAFLVVACGGDDDGSIQGGDTGAASDVVDPGDGGAGGDETSTGGETTASVLIGGSSYEFSPATDCVPDPNSVGGLAIRFDDGDDFVSLNQAGDVVLVRARLDGTEYADSGSPDPPVVSGNNVTWSGEMSGDGETLSAELSFSC